MRDKLIKAMARLKAEGKQVEEGRQQLQDRARAQRDSIGPTIHTVEQHVAADRAGGILGARRLKVLHKERERLDGVLHGGGSPVE